MGLPVSVVGDRAAVGCVGAVGCRLCALGLLAVGCWLLVWGRACDLLLGVRTYPCQTFFPKRALLTRWGNMPKEERGVVIRVIKG